MDESLKHEIEAKVLLARQVLSLFPPDGPETVFLCARGRAVESYAQYEQALAVLYTGLLGVRPDYAGVTFFRINNARARLAILERLLKKRHGSQYNVFWNSFSQHLQKLDERRNHIVHWTTVVKIGVPEGGVDPMRTTTLEPPNTWDRTENTPEILVWDLYDFILKCDFYSRFTNVFAMFVSGAADTIYEPDARAKWREIFQRDVGYPPSNTHPLYRKPPNS